MINVVFLLLIFFLMTASLVTPPPLEITPPEAQADIADPRPGTLFVAADGTLAFGGVTGAAALGLLAETAGDEPLPIMADAAYPAAELARLLPQLSAIGIEDVRLMTVRP